MTKIGEGSQPGAANMQAYRKDIEKSTHKFDQALNDYQTADGEDKARLKAFMEEQLNLINSAVQEIKRGGMYKQDVQLESDYKQFMETGSPESFSAVKHDIKTLQEYNNLP